MTEYSLTLTEDEALVLFEYFARFQDNDDLSFRHAAEYLALQRVAAQIDKTTSAMFKANYGELLESARTRIADGFEGEVPCLKPTET
ncbi:hypothetical protein [Undibacterium sp.]|jgi:hypothetical protein|uniref:hypothetical protein n=1 Tax=Undibacterium sp. TaxID=1914977 RepID=UPI0025E84352|nr:hypothetical protein [Undibacterium sp.]